MVDPISAVVATTAVVNELSVLLAAISTLLVKIATGAASAIAFCSIATKYLPPPEAGSKLENLYKLVNALAQNAGYAENKSK
jgi:hypothetical protein